MNVEIPHISKEKAVKATALTVFIAASSARFLVAREASKRREERRLRSESIEQSAGDGNYVTTVEEVKSRLI